MYNSHILFIPVNLLLHFLFVCRVLGRTKLQRIINFVFNFIMNKTLGHEENKTKQGVNKYYILKGSSGKRVRPSYFLKHKIHLRFCLLFEG